MTGIFTSAPGKVLLAGEYAVLHGAPAIVAAVSRRAGVRTGAVSGDSLLHTPGYLPGDWRFRVRDDGRLEWLDEPPVPGAFALFERVLALAGCDAAANRRFVLDTTAFADAASGHKFGLGSSAALAVALTAAVAPGLSPLELFRRARRAHDDFQGGAGSGADVAAAVFGGTVAYRAPVDTAPATLAWPAGLHVTVLWSGRSASTTAGIGRLKDGLRKPRGNASLERLVQQSEQLCASFGRSAAADLLSAFADYAGELQRFDDALDLGIFAAGHAELHAAARDTGLVYKPCGAGGGDVGALFGLDRGRIDGFVGRAGARGFAALDLVLGADGVSTDGRQW